MDIVVRRHATVPFDPAAETAMQDSLLAIGSCYDANRLHHAPTVACAVARHPPVDVARPETVGAVVAVAAAARRREHHHPASTAAKLLCMVREAPVLAKCGFQKF